MKGRQAGNEYTWPWGNYFGRLTRGRELLQHIDALSGAWHILGETIK